MQMQKGAEGVLEFMWNLGGLMSDASVKCFGTRGTFYEGGG